MEAVVKITFGILAHVDAGKTTFSEEILYHTGVLKRPGRVDEQTSHLDTHPIERARGITIYSGQASFEAAGNTYYLGYSGARGFFCGNGTGACCPGLCGTGYQRNGRGAESYGDRVRIAASVRDTDLFVRE